jgi:hypothetical protein
MIILTVITLNSFKCVQSVSYKNFAVIVPIGSDYKKKIITLDVITLSSLSCRYNKM